MQVSALDYSTYTGRLGVGRVLNGRVKTGQAVTVMHGDEQVGTGKISQVLGFEGLDRVDVPEAEAGDIIIIAGLDKIGIGYTICDRENPVGLPHLGVDEPTLTMDFMVNTSPLAGTEGKFITSRQIRERLTKELLVNVALRVEDTDDADVFRVSGRGELHLTILLETMRREGFEIAVGKPKVVYREIDGTKCEPYEILTVDVEDDNQGPVMEELGRRKGEMQNMESDGNGRTRLEYKIPARGLIGFQGEFLTLTRGTGLMAHIFDEYAPAKSDMPGRRNGVLISSEKGEAVAYALWKLQDRGKMFAKPGDKLYEGMIIGIHSRDNDLVVNPIKGKQLTNVRSSGTDEAVRLITPIALTLESAVEFIDDDELVEMTPTTIRMRKRFLTEVGRKRSSKG
jgi:GTP-binding protein